MPRGSNSTAGIEALKRAREERKAAGIKLVRVDPIEKAKTRPKSLRFAINAKCWECANGQRSVIRDCTVDCSLHPVRPYQMGDDEVEGDEADENGDPGESENE